MKLLAMGAGMMGSAVAFDMARTPQVSSVALADSDAKRMREVAARVNRIKGEKKLRAAALDATDEKEAAGLMHGHDESLSAVPYFLNLDLARAAIEARCHFADLGGNNTVVRRELALAKKAVKHGIAIAPDCGLSPGMASTLGGELVRRLEAAPMRYASRSVAYRNGLLRRFITSLCFRFEGLINEYVEPARVPMRFWA